MIDVGVVVAMVTAFGAFAGGLVTLFGGKNQKVIDMITTRLERTERRIDTLEDELQEERRNRIILLVYAESLHNWAKRAYKFILEQGLEFDEPPVRRDVEVQHPEHRIREAGTGKEQNGEKKDSKG